MTVPSMTWDDLRAEVEARIAAEILALRRECARLARSGVPSSNTQDTDVRGRRPPGPEPRADSAGTDVATTGRGGVT